MTSLADSHGAHEAPPTVPSSPWRRYLLGPGWIRALWMAPLFAAIGFGIVVAFRWWGGYEPLLQTESSSPSARSRPRRSASSPASAPSTTGCTTSSASRRCPRTTPATAPPLEGLLPGQHRPQGDRDPVRHDDDLLLPRRRPAGDGRTRRARAAGDAVHRHGDLQRPLLGARLADDLPLRHPGLRRARELRHPADDRRAGHGVPAPERAVVLDAADRRDDDARRASSSRAGRSRPAGPATRRSRRRCRSARRSSTWPSSGPARRRS